MGSSQASAPQTPTSAQNPVFGSVAEAKPTPGVLPLTFIFAALQYPLLQKYEAKPAEGD